ncbi:TonB-dependent siderophore receptor [Reyranella sp. CPCC 100927]|nr:TonB-dependent siderophore receptor [Reyranella sp. CPCC 100927]
MRCGDGRGRQVVANKGRIYTAGALSTALALAAAVGAGPAARAQQQGDGPAPGSTTLDPVTVHGTRTDPARGPVRGFVAPQSAAGTKTNTKVLETPQSISVITRDQLDAQGAQTITQAMRYSAGVGADLYGTDGRSDWFVIRGFGADVYVDGLRLPKVNNTSASGGFANFRVEPYALERIEVLRGPSSVLYGRANPGGVVNLVSKDPPSEPFYEANAQVGTRSRFQGSFDVGGPVTADKTLLYRLTALVRDADLQVKGGTDDRIAINPAFTWRPDAQTSLTVHAMYLHDSNRHTVSFLPASGTLLSNPFRKLPTNFNDGQPGFDRYKKNEAMLGYRFSHQLDDVWTFRQNLRYAHLDLDYRTMYGTGLRADQRTLTRFGYQARPSLDSIAVDNQAQAAFSTGPVRHTVLMGVDYQWQHLKTRTWGTASVPTLDIVNPDYNQVIPNLPVTGRGTETQRQLGIYAQDQIRWDRWALTIGGRQDWTQQVNRNRLNGSVVRQDPDHFSWRAGLVYLSAIGLAPYISYSTSFQPTSGTTFSGTPFKPTTGRQYEAGVKFQPTGFNSAVTVSFFHTTQQNVLTADPDPTHRGFSVQTGAIRSKGIEVEGTLSLTNNLRMIGSLTLQDVKVTKSNGADLGKRPYAIPHTMASLWADYAHPVSDRVTVGVGGGVRYLGRTAGSVDNSLMVPGVTLFDAMAYVDVERWRLSINAANLFDKAYVAYCSGGTGCNYGARRTVIANLRYRW